MSVLKQRRLRGEVVASHVFLIYFKFQPNVGLVSVQPVKESFQGDCRYRQGLFELSTQRSWRTKQETGGSVSGHTTSAGEGAPTSTLLCLF